MADATPTAFNPDEQNTSEAAPATPPKAKAKAKAVPKREPAAKGDGWETSTSGFAFRTRTK